MTDKLTIGDRLTAEFATEWHTDIEYARVTDSDFVIIMRKDDFDVLATDPIALVSYFDWKRTEHAAGKPTGTTRAERVAEFRSALDAVAGEATDVITDERVERT